MNAHVFECHEERGSRTQYTRTLEALGEYAAKHLKYPEDLKPIFGDIMTTPTLTAPIEPPRSPSPTRIQELKFESQWKSYHRRSEELRSNLITLYAVIWGQCSDQMKNKLRALDDVRDFLNCFIDCNIKIITTMVLILTYSY
jgi:hypothetical protein